MSAPPEWPGHPEIRKRGHGVRAQQLPGDERAGRVREPDRPLERPVVQQAVDERAAERVARPEPVDHLDRDRRHLDGLRARAREDALRAALDDRELDAELEQRGGRLLGVARPGHHGRLVAVADRHGGVLQRELRPAAGLGLVGPEHRPVVEVVDGDPAVVAGGERGERRAAARLLRQAGAGGPEHARGADRVVVELVGGDRHVGRRRLPVEEQREVVGREDLAEHDRRAQRRVGADPPRVDAEALERLAHERAERVVADLGDDRGARAQAGGGDRHVGRAAAERLRERADVLERDAGLLRIEVDADPAHRDQVVRHAISSRRRVELGRDAGQLDAERGGGRGGVEARVVGDRCPRRLGRAEAQQLSVELERFDCRAGELGAGGVLAAAAVEDAGGAALGDAPDQLGRVGGERGRRDHVDVLALPDRERLAGAERVDERRDEVAEAVVLAAGGRPHPALRCTPCTPAIRATAPRSARSATTSSLAALRKP